MELFTPSKKSIWTCSYKGHEIKVENTAKATLYIDGNEADKQKALISVLAILEAELPDSNETVTAIVGGTDDVDCRIIIGQKMETTFTLEKNK